jgi:hypothetical protein
MIGQFLGNYGPFFDAIDRERQPARSEDLPSTRTPPASSTTLNLLKNRSARGPCDEFGERSMVGWLDAMDNAFCPAKSQDDGLSSPPEAEAVALVQVRLPPDCYNYWIISTSLASAFDRKHPLTRPEHFDRLTGHANVVWNRPWSVASAVTGRFRCLVDVSYRPRERYREHANIEQPQMPRVT